MKRRLSALGALIALVMATLLLACDSGNDDFVRTPDRPGEPLGTLTLRLDLTNSRLDVLAQGQGNTIESLRVEVPRNSGGSPFVVDNLEPLPDISIRVPLDSSSCRIDYVGRGGVVLFESYATYQFNSSGSTLVENPYRSKLSLKGQFFDIEIEQEQVSGLGPGDEVEFNAFGRNSTGLVNITDLGEFKSSDEDVLGFLDSSRPNIGTVTGQGRTDITFEIPDFPTGDLAVTPDFGLPLVVLFDQEFLLDDETVHSFLAFEPGFRGGLNLAMGDVTGDGLPDVVVGPGEGRAPEIRVFPGPGFERASSFFAYSQDFAGGVSLATGDVNGDGIDDIITGAGPGGPPQVRIFDAQGTQLGEFFPYGESFTGGVRVAAGPVLGDDRTDIVTGQAQDTQPQIRVFSTPTFTLAEEFTVSDLPQPGGTLDAGDFNNDGSTEIGIGFPSGGPSVIQLYNPLTGEPLEPIVLDGTNSGSSLAEGHGGFFGGLRDSDPTVGVGGIFVGRQVRARDLNFSRTIQFAEGEASRGVRVAAVRTNPTPNPVKAVFEFVLNGGSSTTTTGSVPVTTGGSSSDTTGGNGGGSGDGGSGPGGGSGGTPPPPPPVVIALPVQVYPNEVDSVVEPDVAINDDFIAVVAQRQNGVSSEAILLQQLAANLTAAIPETSVFQGSTPVAVAQSGAGTSVSTGRVTIDQQDRYTVAWLNDVGAAQDVNVRSFTPASNPLTTGSAVAAPFQAQNGDGYSSPGLDSSTNAAGQFYLGALLDDAGGPSVAGGFLTHFQLNPFAQLFEPLQLQTTTNRNSDVSLNPDNSYGVQVWTTETGNVRGRLLVGPEPFSPDATEFAVHTFASGVARELSVDFLGDDRFVVVHDFGPIGSRGVLATLFQINATPPLVTASNVFVVTGTVDSYDPDVAADVSDGSFWVSWTREATGSTQIQVQRFASDGTSLTPGPIGISGVGDVAGTATNSAVALNDSGGGMFVWEADEEVANPGVRAIFARLFQRQDD